MGAQTHREIAGNQDRFPQQETGPGPDPDPKSLHREVRLLCRTGPETRGAGQTCQ